MKTLPATPTPLQYPPQEVFKTIEYFANKLPQTPENVAYVQEFISQTGAATQAAEINTHIEVSLTPETILQSKKTRIAETIQVLLSQHPNLSPNVRSRLENTHAFLQSRQIANPSDAEISLRVIRNEADETYAKNSASESAIASAKLQGTETALSVLSKIPNPSPEIQTAINQLKAEEASTRQKIEDSSKTRNNSYYNDLTDLDLIIADFETYRAGREAKDLARSVESATQAHLDPQFLSSEPLRQNQLLQQELASLPLEKYRLSKSELGNLERQLGIKQDSYQRHLREQIVGNNIRLLTDTYQSQIEILQKEGNLDEVSRLREVVVYLQTGKPQRHQEMVAEYIRRQIIEHSKLLSKADLDQTVRDLVESEIKTLQNALR